MQILLLVGEIRTSPRAGQPGQRPLQPSAPRTPGNKAQPAPPPARKHPIHVPLSPLSLERIMELDSGGRTRLPGDMPRSLRGPGASRAAQAWGSDLCRPRVLGSGPQPRRCSLIEQSSTLETQRWRKSRKRNCKKFGRRSSWGSSGRRACPWAPTPGCGSAGRVRKASVPPAPVEDPRNVRHVLCNRLYVRACCAAQCKIGGSGCREPLREHTQGGSGH